MRKKPRRKPGVANPEAAKAAAERARSNAAGTHLDKRTRRARTRAARKAREVEDQTSD